MMYLPVRLLVCTVWSCISSSSLMIVRSLMWNSGIFYPSPRQKGITRSWYLGPSTPSWGLMANTTAIIKSNPLSLFMYTMSLTCDFWCFWWGYGGIFNKINSECSWEFLKVFFFCGIFRMCVWWKEKFRDFVNIFFHRSPDCVIWPNYDVVVFQPRSGISTVLESVDSDYNLFYPPALPALAAFWVFFPSPCYRPPSVAVAAVAPLCHNRFPPPFHTWNAVHLDVYRTRHLPASAACICAPRPAPRACVCSAEVSWICPPPPFSDLGIYPSPFQPLGVRPPQVPPYLLCPASLPLCCTASHHILGLGLFECPFSCEVKRPGHIHSLSVALPGPRPPCYMSMPAPSGYPDPLSSSPPCRLDPIPVREGGGASR